MGAELRSLEVELVEVRSVLEEAAAVAERFRAPRERGAREEWLVRMLGAAALARLRAGDPLGSELLAGGPGAVAGDGLGGRGAWCCEVMGTCSGLRSSELGREIIAVSGSHYLRL